MADVATSASEWQAFDLDVAARVVRHISQGIYRTPGGAIKELISNSFDAQATFAKVETSAPSFSTFVVKDDGRGMNEEDIRQAFSHVGASMKSISPGRFRGEFKRPLIGQFGVGILAAANLSPVIRLRTVPADSPETAFRCEIDLRPFLALTSRVKTLEQVSLGTVRFRKEEGEVGPPGTEVTLSPIDKKSNFYRTVRRKGFDPVDWPGPKRRSEDSGSRMEAFVRAVQSKGLQSVTKLSGRAALLWELGQICPVEYLPNGPVSPDYLTGDAGPIVEEIVAENRRNAFKLFLDGVEVRKPILLPAPKARTSYVDDEDPTLRTNATVFPIIIPKKGAVSAKGYLVFHPHRVLPREIQGLYPRVSGVGVGRYDNSLFSVIQGEQPVIRVRLSGEIYVRGMDSAISLDRSGFNELTKEYETLVSSLQKLFLGRSGLLSLIRHLTDEHSERVNAVKTRVRGRRRRQAARKRIRRRHPKYVVAEEGQTPTGSGPIIEYPFVRVHADSMDTELVGDPTDPAIPDLIVAVDAFLSELPGGIELRQQLADRLRSLFAKK